MATLALPAKTRAPASTALLEATSPRTLAAAARAEPASELTLDDRISTLWHGLAGSTAVSCPWCGADMVPRWSAGAGVVGGRCEECATTLE